jgi:hypothetical protein
MLRILGVKGVVSLSRIMGFLLVESMLFPPFSSFAQSNIESGGISGDEQTWMNKI